jgi:hypothetical protein
VTFFQTFFARFRCWSGCWCQHQQLCVVRMPLARLMSRRNSKSGPSSPDSKGERRRPTRHSSSSLSRTHTPIIISQLVFLWGKQITSLQVVLRHSTCPPRRWRCLPMLGNHHVSCAPSLHAYFFILRLHLAHTHTLTLTRLVLKLANLKDEKQEKKGCPNHTQQTFHLLLAIAQLP